MAFSMVSPYFATVFPWFFHGFPGKKHTQRLALRVAAPTLPMSSGAAISAAASVVAVVTSAG